MRNETGNTKNPDLLYSHFERYDPLTKTTYSPKRVLIMLGRAPKDTKTPMTTEELKYFHTLPIEQRRAWMEAGRVVPNSNQ